MSRRIVLPWLLALAVACAAAAQSSGQPAPDAPTPQPGASQQAPPQDTTAQSSAQTDQKKKDGWLKRTLKRAAPDCVNIGTSYCRDESQSEWMSLRRTSVDDGRSSSMANASLLFIMLKKGKRA